ncbi:hypothetical protein Tco_1453659 [Tanacetum coccineum]
MSLDAQLLINFKKGSKFCKKERLIQELSGDPREGSAARNETQDDRDSLDSDKTLRAPKLESVDEGEEDDASNFTVFVHGTSGLNSHDESSRKEEPNGDSVDLDRLTKSQTVVLTSCTSDASENPLDALAQSLNLLVQPITDTDVQIPSPPIITVITTKPTTLKGKKNVRRIVTRAKRFTQMAKKFKYLQEKVEEQ